MKKILVALIATLAILAQLLPVMPASGLTPAQVIRVVDGDTLVAAINGQEYKVRLIGVDAPETVNPTKGIQPYGPEASAYTKSKLEGKTVWLERDVSETDRYGRLLAYVWLEDGTLFNASLILYGYAQVFTWPPDVKYVDYFVRLQRLAQSAGAGLWGLDPS